MKETKIYKIRVTGEVLETANATRRVNVDGQVLTFGLEPVYVRAAELPPQLADDPSCGSRRWTPRPRTWRSSSCSSPSASRTRAGSVAPPTRKRG